MVQVLLGDPRIHELKAWWTAQRFRHAVFAAQERLRDAGCLWGHYYVSLRLGGISVRTLRRYMRGETELPNPRILRCIDEGFKGLLGDEWLEEWSD